MKNRRNIIYIFYTDPSEREFLQLSQITDRYNVFYYLVESQDEINSILNRKHKDDIIYLTTSSELRRKFLILESYQEFMEKSIKAIYIKDPFRIPIKESHSKFFFKRLFDITMAIFLLVITFPIWLIVMFLIKLDIGLLKSIKCPILFLKNPCFFIQNRIGKNRKIIKILKFRSMYHHNVEEYSKFPTENDTRITWIGNIIRKLRIDELPQILNILKGDMSFIGPRPEWDILGYEYEKSIPNYFFRYEVLPGITGWAQIQYIYGSGVEDAKIKLSYELYYIKHQSIFLDFEIILKTIKVIFLGKGM
jgi:undecaprenyl-phosphate galactose phosphotransferase